MSISEKRLRMANICSLCQGPVRLDGRCVRTPPLVSDDPEYKEPGVVRPCYGFSARRRTLAREAFLREHPELRSPADKLQEILIVEEDVTARSAKPDEQAPASRKDSSEFATPTLTGMPAYSATRSGIRKPPPQK